MSARMLCSKKCLHSYGERHCCQKSRDPGTCTSSCPGVWNFSSSSHPPQMSSAPRVSLTMRPAIYFKMAWRICVGHRGRRPHPSTSASWNPSAFWLTTATSLTKSSIPNISCPFPKMSCSRCWTTTASPRPRPHPRPRRAQVVTDLTLPATIAAPMFRPLYRSPTYPSRLGQPEVTAVSTETRAIGLTRQP